MSHCWIQPEPLCFEIATSRSASGMASAYRPNSRSSQRQRRSDAARSIKATSAGRAGLVGVSGCAASFPLDVAISAWMDLNLREVSRLLAGFGRAACDLPEVMSSASRCVSRSNESGLCEESGPGRCERMRGVLPARRGSLDTGRQKP
jgi:hypothetical protein